MKVCPNCKNENPSQANFCSSCGNNLKDVLPINQRDIPDQQDGTKRAAERRQLTILFCDLVGSTPLSGQLDPEDYRQVITDYHELAEEVINQYGGHVAQYLGDGLLVYFGYPKGLEDAPRAGVQAGLGILAALKEANKDWVVSGKTEIKVRIGVHTGLVVVDDHLALGETVNAAARLEGLAPHNGLVISPQTMSLVKGWFHVKSLGSKVLKGISEPMEIYHVLEESAAITRLDIAKSQGLSPLVGRHQELEVLATCWGQAKNGQGNLLLLNGEAGIGKSRLVDTLEQIIEQDPEGWICVARCSAYHRHSSFHPIIELLGKGILKFRHDDSLDDILTKLETFILQTGLEKDTVLPLFAELLSIHSEAIPPPAMSPFAKRQRILENLTKALLYRLSHEPSLFVIEDLHWADASTLEWLDLFMRQIPARSIFVLCTTRPVYKPEWEGRPAVSQLTLQRLSAENMMEICHHQTKGRILPNEILNQITTKTEGIPLFVEELTKMILESDMMVENDESYEVMGSLSDLSIPSTLQDSLLARLDRLSHVKEIVQIGSVIGREFSLDMLNAVLPEKENQMEQSISKLLDAEIFNKIDAGELPKYQFKHALIQDAAYESLLKSRRQELHNQVAKVLENQFAETIQAQPELLAHHYTEANQPVKAIPIWLKAGQMASQKNATSEAINHLVRGLGLLPHLENADERKNLELDFLLMLGGTYVVSHGFPHEKVKETFNQAREVAFQLELSPKLALIQLNLLSYYMNTEAYEPFYQMIDQMMEFAKDKENGYWFDLLAHQLLGGGHAISGDFEKSSNAYSHAIEMFDPAIPFPWELAPSGYLEIGAKGWWMVILLILGEMDKAKYLYDPHLDLAEHHKDSMTLYHVYTFPALFDLEVRRWKQAEEAIESYFPIVRAFGDPVFTLTAEVYYYIAKANQGDDSAFGKAVQLINVCFDIGFKAFAVSLSPYIGEHYHDIGEDASALKWVEKILDHVNTTGSHIRTAELFRIKALALQGLGKPNAIVEEFFNKALALARKQSAKLYELRISRDLARFWIKQNKLTEAYNLLKEIHDWFVFDFEPIDLLEVRKMLTEWEK